METAKSKWFIWAAVALLVLAIGIFCLVFWINSTHKASAQATMTAKFSFSDTPAWHLGFSNQKPAVSQVIFSDDGTCFISAEYDKGTVDVATEVQKSVDSLANSGNAVASLQNAEVSMTVDGRITPYSIYQQAIADSPSSSQQIKQGQGLGFIQLGDHYIKVLTSCDTPNQLDGTVVAVKNISFHS